MRRGFCFALIWAGGKERGVGVLFAQGFPERRDQAADFDGDELEHRKARVRDARKLVVRFVINDGYHFSPSFSHATFNGMLLFGEKGRDQRNSIAYFNHFVNTS